MLLNLSKKTWTEGLLLHNFTNHAASNEKVHCSGWLHTTCCVQQFKQHPCTHLLRAKVFSVFCQLPSLSLSLHSSFSAALPCQRLCVCCAGLQDVSVLMLAAARTVLACTPSGLAAQASSSVQALV
jgi:hypothetical protein